MNCKLIVCNARPKFKLNIVNSVWKTTTKEKKSWKILKDIELDSDGVKKRCILSKSHTKSCASARAYQSNARREGKLDINLNLKNNIDSSLKKNYSSNNYSGIARKKAQRVSFALILEDTRLSLPSACISSKVNFSTRAWLFPTSSGF